VPNAVLHHVRAGNRSRIEEKRRTVAGRAPETAALLSSVDAVYRIPHLAAPLALLMIQALFDYQSLKLSKSRAELFNFRNQTRLVRTAQTQRHL